MNKLKWAMMGGGSDSLIGVLHRIAAYTTEKFTLVGGVFSDKEALSRSFGEELQLDQSRIYPDISTFLEKEGQLDASERVEIVTIATPNFLHYPMAKSLLEAGYHVICEKPMTMNASEAHELSDLVQTTGKKFALTHTYTGYPMVRQMRAMIKEGAIGKIQKVDAQYYQGWINPIIHDAEKRKTTWRLDPARSGMTCCYGDIGVHAFNMVEYTTGLKVNEVLSDLNTLYDDVQLDIDGTSLVRFEDGTKGLIRCSQIATCEENNLSIAVYGDKGALKWEQHNPNYLTFMQEGSPMQVIKPGYSFNHPMAIEATKLPPGHPEGIFDSMANIYKGIALDVRGKNPPAGSYPTVMDGLRGMRFIESAVASSAEGNVWKAI